VKKLLRVPFFALALCLSFLLGSGVAGAAVGPAADPHLNPGIVSGVYNGYTIYGHAAFATTTEDAHCYFVGYDVNGLPHAGPLGYYRCFVEKQNDPVNPPYPNIAPTSWYEDQYDWSQATQRNVGAYTANGWTCYNLGRGTVNVIFSCLSLRV
jgi:hypothetical protein